MLQLVDFMGRSGGSLNLPDDSQPVRLSGFRLTGSRSPLPLSEQLQECRSICTMWKGSSMEGHDFVTVQKGGTVFGLCWLWTCAASDALIISLLCSIAVGIVRQQLRSVCQLC